MMDARLFDNLDAVLRAVRQSPAQPFGGMAIIIIVTGGFHQLPPIDKRRTWFAIGPFLFATHYAGCAVLTC